MNNSTVDFTHEASINSTILSFGVLDYLQSVVYSINLLFGLPTNSYIIWLIVMKTRSGVALEIFILNHTVCEIGISLNGVVFIVSWWCGDLVNLDLFLIGLTVTGRPLFQSLICVERYLAVVHPVTFLKYKPLRYRLICCTAAWIIIFGSALVCVYTMALENTYIYAWFTSTQLMLLVIVQMFCLVAVLKALKQSGPGERKRDEENHMKKRAFNLILINTVTTFILFFPFVIAGIVIIVTADNFHTVWFFGWACFVLAGFVQPFLYLHQTGKLACLCSS